VSSDCIFCSIVDGDVPGRIVHEDDDSTAFLDVNPLAPGHVLVVPNDHLERLQDVPDNRVESLYRTIHDLVPAVEEAVEADATNVAFNNGEAAGQEVPHLHCHVVPRFAEDDGGPIHAAFGDRPDLDDEELDGIADRIREAR
jgi:histidine triad (HIT) family protein